MIASHKKTFSRKDAKAQRNAKKQRNRRLCAFASLREEPSFVLFCGSLSDDEFSDRLQLHVRRAFINRTDLRIAPVFLDRIILHVTITTVELNRFRADALS